MQLTVRPLNQPETVWNKRRGSHISTTHWLSLGSTTFPRAPGKSIAW